MFVNFSIRHSCNFGAIKDKSENVRESGGRERMRARERGNERGKETEVSEKRQEKERGGRENKMDCKSEMLIYIEAKVQRQFLQWSQCVRAIELG